LNISATWTISSSFFSKEIGEALIPSSFIEIFQGIASENILVLAKHYMSQGIELLKAVYEKAKLKTLE
jgi:hypothetical protein